MGCTESNQVIERKQILQVLPQQKINKEIKPIQKTIIKQIPERGQCFLIGSFGQNQQVFVNVKLQSMTMNKMSLPTGGFKCYNFSSILEIEKSKYFISGGINHDLTKISNQTYLYSSDLHNVVKLEDMSQARYTHVSIFSKQKNELYVVGGRYYGDDSKGILTHCEKYSFQHKIWIRLPDLNIKRCTCFIYFWNQIIYVFGGYTGPLQRSTKIQYLSKNQQQWKILDFQIQRGIQGAILLPIGDNQITIFGGLVNSGPTDSVISINLKQKSIKSKINLQSARSLHKSFYKNGKVYIFGGDDNFSSQIYDIKNRKSTLITKQYPLTLEQFDNLGVSTASVQVSYSQNQQKLKHSQQTDQILYIFGTTEEPFLCQLNISIPETNFYSIPLNLKLYAHQGGVMISKSQFILFGGIQDDSLSVISSDTYLFNIKTKKAKKIAKMHQNRYAFSYNTYKSNKQKEIDYIYCFGGATSNLEGNLVFLSACQRFSIKQSKWELIVPLPEKIISPMSILYKQNFFVFGGTNQKNCKVRDIFMYSIKQNSWTTLQSRLSFGLQAGSVTQISENQFYIFGGRLQNGLSSGIWSLYLNEKIQNKKKQIVCVFQQKGQMNEKKSLHKIYKPKNQDFYVVFGGDNYPLSFYRKNLEQQSSDLLLNMKQMFLNTLEHLNHRNLKGYLMVSEQ